MSGGSLDSDNKSRSSRSRSIDQETKRFPTKDMKMVASFVEDKRIEEAKQAEKAEVIRQKVLNFTRKYPDRRLPEIVAKQQRGLCAYAMRLNRMADSNYQANRKSMDLKLRGQENKVNNKREARATSLPEIEGHYRKSHESGSLDVPLPDEMDVEHLRPGLEKNKTRFTFRTSHWLRHKLDDEGENSIAWLNERLALSCRSCRFELPMDMKQFEKMTAQDYIVKYCKIPPHRQMIYKKLFNKYKSKLTGLLTLEDLENCIQIILSRSVEGKDLHRLLRSLSFNDNSTIKLPLFSAVCAVAERITYCSFIEKYGQTGINRSYLEDVDFCNLEWKLTGIEIDPYLKRLLMSLGS